MQFIVATSGTGRCHLDLIRTCLFATLGFLAAYTCAHAQHVPGGCPGQWVQGGGGMMCQCPDGSFASGWPNMTCAGGSYQQPQVNWCSNNMYCQQDQTCCGNHCCNPGAQCSRFNGCIPEGAAECGRGGFCNAGTRCWTAPLDVSGIRRGQIKCLTDEQAAYCNLVAAQREADARKKEEEAAARRRAEQQRKADEEARKRKAEEQIAAKSGNNKSLPAKPPTISAA